MSDKIIITVSGKKEAGKNTLCNMIAAHIANKLDLVPGKQFGVSTGGELGYPTDDGTEFVDIGPGHTEESPLGGPRGVRILSFADLLKETCIRVLGLKHEQCYGRNHEKETLTHLRWDRLPLAVRWRYRAKWCSWPRSGFMTGREVMQVFGSDIMRAWWPDVWATATLQLAKSCVEPVVLICDGRFPNEIDATNAAGGLTVRLLRSPHNDTHISETALDNYNGEYHAVMPADAGHTDYMEFVMTTVESWLQ